MSAISWFTRQKNVSTPFLIISRTLPNRYLSTLLLLALSLVGIAGANAVLSVPAQADPGGVGADLSLWLSGGEGMTLEDDRASVLADQSPNGNDAIQMTPAARPGYNENGLNFNPTLDFSAAEEYLSLTNPINPTQTTVFGVGRRDNPGSVSAFWRGNQPTGDYQALVSGNNFGYWDSAQDRTTDLVWNDRETQLFSGLLPGVNGEKARYNLAGGEYLSTNGTGLDFTGDAYAYLGNEETGRGYQFGEVAETIIYETGEINAFEKRKIESYLALKYGLTLETTGGNYLNSNGDVVYDVLETGTLQTHSAADNDEDWLGVAYGNGLYVAVTESVFNNDVVMTSPDGITWTPRSALGDDDAWTAVTYGAGQFVAVGYANRVGADQVMTSPDGIIWTTQASPNPNEAWRSVTYGGGQFVAVGDTGTDRIMTSPDGITWTSRPSPSPADQWLDVEYGNGIYVAVGYNGNRVATSTDGITWTAQTPAGNDDPWTSVTYGQGLFVAVGEGADQVMTSTNGRDWTVRSGVGNNEFWTGVTYGNGRFLAVADSAGQAMTSRDGINWTGLPMPGDDDGWLNVTYGSGRFVGVGYPYNFDLDDQVILTLDENSLEYRELVVGLARDDASKLDQRASKSQEDGAILTLATDDDFETPNNDSRTALDDGQYLVLGSNNDSVQLTPTDLLEYDNRLPRQWRARNTSQVGPVNFRFDFPEVASGTWELVQSDTPDFADPGANLTSLATLDNVGTSQATLADTKYYGLFQTPAPAAFVVDKPAGITLEEEGPSDAFQVTLQTAPQNNVEIIVTSDNPDLTLSPATLAFTPADWSEAQSVLVSAGSDDDLSDDTATLSFAPDPTSSAEYAALAAITRPVTVLDSDEANVVLEGVDSDEEITLGEDQTDLTLDLALSARPTGDVQVDLVSSDSTALVVFPETLFFEPDDANNLVWSNPQTVSLTPVPDDDSLDDEVTLTLNFSGAASEYAGLVRTINLTITDNDSEAAPVEAPTTLIRTGGVLSREVFQWFLPGLFVIILSVFLWRRRTK